MQHDYTRKFEINKKKTCTSRFLLFSILRQNIIRKYTNITTENIPLALLRFSLSNLSYYVFKVIKRHLKRTFVDL